MTFFPISSGDWKAGKEELHYFHELIEAGRAWAEIYFRSLIK
jgi:hypothetical protein